MKKTFLFLILAAVIVIGGAVLLKYGGSADFLWNMSQQGKLLLPLISVAAIIDSINPCAFSILLLTIAFLFSIGRFRSNILKIGGVYIFGLFLVYMLIGLGILQALHVFGIPHFMGKIGAGLLIALGLINVINEFFPSFPIKLKIPHAAHSCMATLMEKGSYVTAFLLGALVGLCEFPCTGGPYLMVLGLLHDQATYLKGFFYLVFYNIIFVLPLVIILLIASHPSLLEKARTWQRSERKFMRFAGGIAMILLGILIFFL